MEFPGSGRQWGTVARPGCPMVSLCARLSRESVYNRAPEGSTGRNCRGAGNRVTANPIFLWPVRVYYEDTDAAGIVYHASYLKYFERARTEWLRQLGFGQERLKSEHGLAFALASAEVRWQRPARLDDRLQVSVKVLACGRVRIDFEQQITRVEDHQLMTTAIMRVGCIETTRMRPRRMPAVMTAEITNVG